MSLSDEEFLTLRFWRSGDIGPKRFWQAYHHYGSVTKAYGHVPMVSEQTILNEVGQTQGFGASFVFFHDFPTLLKSSADVPPVLVAKGSVDLWYQSCVGIVGSRNASYAGRTIAKGVASGLGQAGHVIVSGFAQGVDGAAHEASILTGTIAVMAGGIDIVYPKAHQKLYEGIATQGLLLSEMSFGTTPQPHLFPRRNRLIAAISIAVVVIEAGKPSGSLITADYALKYGRDVMAVPGTPLDGRSRGSNALLKDGAILVESADDCLAHLSPSLWAADKSRSVKEKESAHHSSMIFDDLSTVPITLDELMVLHPELPPQLILRNLGELMLQGLVMDLPPGGHYVRSVSSL